MRLEEALDVIDLWLAGKIQTGNERLETAMDVYSGLVERIEIQQAVLKNRPLGGFRGEQS